MPEPTGSCCLSSLQVIELVVAAIEPAMAALVLPRAARSPARCTCSGVAPRAAAANMASVRRCSICSARLRLRLLRNDMWITFQVGGTTNALPGTGVEHGERAADSHLAVVAVVTVDFDGAMPLRVTTQRPCKGPHVAVAGSSMVNLRGYGSQAAR